MPSRHRNFRSCRLTAQTWIRLSRYPPRRLCRRHCRKFLKARHTGNLPSRRKQTSRARGRRVEKPLTSLLHRLWAKAPGRLKMLLAEPRYALEMERAPILPVAEAAQGPEWAQKKVR